MLGKDFWDKEKKSSVDLRYKDITEIEVKIKEPEKFGKPFVKTITITGFLKCVTTPGYIRFLCKTDDNFTELIPVILLSYAPGLSSYSSADGSLTLKIYNRMVSFLPPNEIGITNTKDKDAAVEFTQILGDILNRAYNYYLKNGSPTEREIEAVKKVKWLDIYAFLPRLNCKKCGLEVCSAFAVSVMTGEKKLNECPFLKEPKYKKKLLNFRKKFGERLLTALGCECL
ncbi:MAG: (Fe-S)-binding protein [Promethearchaeota archaeon]